MNAKTVATIDRDLIEDALDDTNTDTTERHVSSIHSCGTAMTCASITFPGIRDLAVFMFSLGRATEHLSMGVGDPESDRITQAVTAMSRALRVDSMGTGLVAYFPGFAFGDM